MSRVAAGILGLALLLRLPRALARWDEVAWQYAAYNQPTADALQDGRLAEALTTFAGLHPPVYPLIHSLLSLAWPAPVLWLLTSVAFSLGAVALTLRGGWLAALLLACGAVQLSYAAEVNNYPLTALVVAATWWARDRVAEGRPWWELALVGALAGWVHGLAAWVAATAALTLGARRAGRILAVMVIAAAPLWPAVWDLATEPGTFRQPPIEPALIASAAWERFGGGWLLLLPLGVAGARRRPALAVGLVATEGFVIALQIMGIAAPHQFPYHLAAGIPLAWLGAAGVEAAGRHRRSALALALAVAVLQAGTSLTRDVRAQAEILADGPRALDVALAEAEPGDAIVLLTPPRTPDDDKRGTSPVLWHIPPWTRLPPVRPYAFAYDDHRHGQPRDLQGVAIYLHEQPRSTFERLVEAHRRTFLCVYDHRDDPRYTDELEARWGAAAAVGPDLLFRSR